MKLPRDISLSIKKPTEDIEIQGIYNGKEFKKTIEVPKSPFEKYKHMWDSLKSAKCGNKSLEAEIKALMETIEESYK